MERWKADLVKTMDRLVQVLERIASEMERSNQRQECDEEDEER